MHRDGVSKRGWSSQINSQAETKRHKLYWDGGLANFDPNRPWPQRSPRFRNNPQRSEKCEYFHRSQRLVQDRRHECEQGADQQNKYDEPYVNWNTVLRESWSLARRRLLDLVRYLVTRLRFVRDSDPERTVWSWEHAQAIRQGAQRRLQKDTSPLFVGHRDHA